MKITIVGSMKFYDEFVKAKEYLEERGHYVILPRKDPMPEPIPKDFKLKAMQKFNENLAKADAILVMNYTKDDKENHIGVNSLMEIGMAFNREKKIFVLNKMPESCLHELEAINCVVLNGKLDSLD
jgi:diphthamide synthase subunit DPH2|tara:strand:- start:427 stop:804 length:378 start_codon:yes stop_codon:yes gene_type:complete